MVLKLGNRGSKKAAASSDGDASGAQPPELAAAPAVKKRKADELLSSVVGESTAGSAVGLMRKNENFALPGGKSWVVLGLQVSTIGGLSMKQKNDEAKGSLIQLITADQITTVTTADMLSAEVLGIIPNTASLERMDEFGILRSAKYFWVVMKHKRDGSLDATPVTDATKRASYDDAVAVSQGTATLADLIPEIWEAAAGDNAELTTTPVIVADEPVAEEVAEEVAQPEPAEEPADGSPVALEMPTAEFSEEDNPFGDDPVDYDALDEGDDSLDDVLTAGIDDEMLGGDDEADESEDEVDQIPAAESETAAVATEAEVVQAAPVVSDDRVVDEATVHSSIARRFLTTDLDLEIDLTSFEANFIAPSRPISFDMGSLISDENAGTDWLGQQIALLSQQANVELKQLHENNTAALREYYVSLMSSHIERVIADVSLDQEGSYYQRLSRAAKAGLAERQRQGPEEVAALRKELNERYEAEADARGAQAFEAAKLRYKDQNRARHERELSEIALANERASEALYDGSTQIILETRRKDALSRIDLGMTKIFDVLIERQEENRAAEEALVKRWSAAMTEVIDDNRKDDIARSEALAEQLSRANQVEELKAEQAARIDEMRREQAARVAEMTSDLQRSREEAMAELAAREAVWDNSLAEEREKTETAQHRIKELLKEFELLGPSLEDHYRKQIEAAQANAEQYSQALERSSKVQSRANKTMVALIVVLTLASLAVGFVVGALMSGVGPLQALAPASTSISDVAVEQAPEPIQQQMPAPESEPAPEPTATPSPDATGSVQPGNQLPAVTEP